MRHACAIVCALCTSYVLCASPARAQSSAAPPPPYVPVDSTLRARLLGAWAGVAVAEGETTAAALAFDRRGGDTVVARLWLPALNMYGTPIARVGRLGDGFGLREPRTPLSFVGDTLTGTVFGSLLPLRLTHRDTPLAAAPALPDTGAPGSAARVPRVAWRFEAGAALWASPVVSGGVAYVGDEAGHLHAVSLRDGRALWSFDAGGGIFAPVTVDGDVVYVVADPGVLYRLDRATGRPRWFVSIGAAAGKRSLPALTGSDWDCLASAPVVSGGVLFVGSADSTLRALDAATGRELWRFRTAGKVRGTAAIDARHVYVGSFDHFVYALDRRTGREAWRFDTESAVTHGPLVEGGRVFVGMRDRSRLYALDAATGKKLWQRFWWLSWVDSSPRLADGTLYVGSSDAQRVRAYDPATGRERWQAWVGGWTWGTPLVVGDDAWYATAGGAGYFIAQHPSLGAIDRRTGAIRWRLPLADTPGRWPSGIASSLAYGDGLVLAGALDGTLTAYRPAAAR